MVRIKLTYNPYMVSTHIEIDGAPPKKGSAFNIPAGVRLQEWVENLPIIIQNEIGKKAKLEFVGTAVDFDDVSSALEGSGVSCTQSSIDIKDDVDQAEKTIDKIFSDIQKGPIPELKSERIRSTFNKAKSSEFEVNVVATMSSGKSSLINALLGQRLMPAKQEATTATIVKIKDVDGRKNFSAVAYDKKGNIIKKFPNVTLDNMESLNKDANVYEIDIEGDIKFVSSDGMSLVLVDTPGPNNSRDIHHQEMTFKMLNDSDKSLVLFVMNATQLGINDEKIFLDYICSNMKKGGKKSRDRYIFAVNKLDAFSPKKEVDGEGCINRALNSISKSMGERGIVNANIFPVSAAAALEKRIDDDEPDVLDKFVRKSNKYPEMRFNDYYQYSHQPLSVRSKLNKEMAKLDGYDLVEYYTGIRNIEEAIRLYINKYARTTKICDLVLSFRHQLEELATMAKLEDDLRKNADAKVRLQNEIKKAKELISSSESTKSFTDDIDKSNYTDASIADIAQAISNAKRHFKELVSGKSTKVDLKQAEIQQDAIIRQFNQCAAQINVRIDDIIQSSFKSTVSGVISQYINHISALGITPQYLNLGSYSGISISAPSLQNAMRINKKTYDESYVTEEEYQVRIDSTTGRNGGFGAAAGAAAGATIGSIVPVIGTAFGAFLGGVLGLVGGRISGHDEYYETKYRPKKIEKHTDYINMNEVVSTASSQFDSMLDKLETKARKYVHSENDRIKASIKAKIKDVDKLILKKLHDLEELEDSSKQTDKEREEKTKKKEWLISIQDRVNQLIDF